MQVTRQTYQHSHMQYGKQRIKRNSGRGGIQHHNTEGGDEIATKERIKMKEETCTIMLFLYVL